MYPVFSETEANSVTEAISTTCKSVQPLAGVFNLSLKEGLVPFERKEANIIPLFKIFRKRSTNATSKITR